MENRGITFGYGFLSQESSFDVQFSLIEFDGSHSYFRAYLVGLLNTILVSVIGIIFATIIGVVVGIARLSNNYLINRTAGVYVEFFRNIPLLLQIFFWYFAALRALPLPQDTEPMFGVFFLTIKGLFIPRFVWENLDIFFYSYDFSDALARHQYCSLCSRPRIQSLDFRSIFLCTGGMHRAEDSRNHLLLPCLLKPRLHSSLLLPN